MEEVTLTALTPKGEEALRAMKQKFDVPLRDRFIYTRMFDERILSENPFTLKIVPKGALKGIAERVRIDDFKNVLEIELGRQGAERCLDYAIKGV